MVESGVDKRQHTRRKVLKGAKVVFAGGKSLFDCQVRDWSDSGAKLVFPDRTLLPRQFNLRISDGTEVSCEVVRADGNVFGVRFIIR